MLEIIKRTVMPAAIASLPRDSRGIPIPYINFIPPEYTQDRKVDLRVTDPLKRLQCIRERLCGICGRQLNNLIFFIGGPLCIENRCYSDPGMHRACAEYSITVCPFLRNVSYTVSDAGRKQPVIQDAMACPERPAKMYLVQVSGFEACQIRDGKTGQVHPMVYARVFNPVIIREF